MDGLRVDAPPTGSRRKLKSFFIKPKYQMPYAMYQILGGLGCFGVTVAMVRGKLGQIDALLDKTPIIDAATQTQMNQLFADIATIFMTGFAGYILFASIVIIVVTHRVSGPMIAMVDIIEQLIKGNYGYKRPLRNRDELVPIQESLLVLSQTLLEKRSAQQSEDVSQDASQDVS